MEEKPNSKTLIIVIGVLFIANIVLLSVFLLNGTKSEHKPKKDFLSEYLRNDIGFTPRQLASYDSLSKIHRTRLKSMFNSITPGRKHIFLSLAAASFADSAINNAATRLNDQQRYFEVEMLDHLKDIRNICEEVQRNKFDTSFYKVLVKRGDNNK